MPDQDIQYLREDIQNLSVKIDDFANKFDARIRNLEYWKIGFVAKFSTYSAIALFLGSLIAQIGLKYVLNLIK